MIIAYLKFSQIFQDSEEILKILFKTNGSRDKK